MEYDGERLPSSHAAAVRWAVPDREGIIDPMPTAPIASSPRLDWAGVPEPVRRSVEAALGSSIVSTVTQVGGFSPGAAVRAVLADGRRVFVKACGSALNPDTPDLNRAEILALGLLPGSVPAPQLLTSYDDGDWVALVLEDVEGRRPGLPWGPADVTSMTTSLGRVAGTTAPAPLRTFAVATNVLTGWDEVEADPVGLDREVARRLPEMLEHQALAGDVTVGSALAHWDARNDNVLVRPDGEAVLLDWAWACSGAPWLDTLLLAVDFVVQGGPEPHDFLRTAALTCDVPDRDLRAVVACVVGVWTDRARRPVPPGLPTIREWQAHCAREALHWLDEGSWRR